MTQNWKASTQPSRRKQKKAKKAIARTAVWSIRTRSSAPHDFLLEALQILHLRLGDGLHSTDGLCHVATITVPLETPWGRLRHCHALPWLRCCSPCRRIRRILRPTSSCPTGSSPKLLCLRCLRCLMADSKLFWEAVQPSW